MKEQYWKYSLIIMIVGLGILLFRQAQPFMNGILGAFTLYLLLRGFSNWLKENQAFGLCMDYHNWNNPVHPDTTFTFQLGTGQSDI